jgi:phage tail tape-measure protein
MNTGVTFKISAVDDASAMINKLHSNLQRLSAVPGRISAGFRDFMGPLRSVLGFLQGIGTKLMWIGGIGFGFATAGAYKLTKGIIGAATEMQTLKARLQTLAGSGAAGLWDWATKFAAKTPFELTEIIDSMTQLKAFQLDPVKSLPAIGDFAAAMGRSITDATEAVAEAIQGRSERLRMMAITPEMATAYAQKRGTSAGLDKQGSIVDRGAYASALFGLMAERGLGGMARMMDTIQGKWSNLADAATRFKMALGGAIAPAIQKGIGWLEKIVDWLNTPEHIKVFQDWVNRAFSDENFAKAAGWLDWLYNKAVDVWSWISTDGVNSFNKVLSGAKKIGEYIQNNWIPLLQTAGKIMLDIKAIEIGLGILKFGVDMAGLTRGASIPIAAGIAAVVAGGISAIGGAAIDNIAGQMAGLTGGTNERNLPGPPIGHFVNGRWVSGGAEASAASPFSETLKALGLGGGTDPTQSEIAKNTGDAAAGIQALNGKQNSILSQIYGGGDRLRQLSARYRFGGASAAANDGQAVNITINLSGGTPQQQSDNMAGIQTLARVLNPNAKVHIRRSRN